MNNLTKDLDTILIELIQMPRGKTVSHTDYRNRVLDAVIKALPEDREVVLREGFTDWGTPKIGVNMDSVGYNRALLNIRELLLAAKESE